jgi:hypothetical protein
VRRQAGYVRHCLDLAGRGGIPVIAGAALSMTTMRIAAGWTVLGSSLPPWGAEMDFNVQWDTRAAEIVAATASLWPGVSVNKLRLSVLCAASHAKVRHAPDRLYSP